MSQIETNEWTGRARSGEWWKPFWTCGDRRLADLPQLVVRITVDPETHFQRDAQGCEDTYSGEAREQFRTILEWEIGKMFPSATVEFVEMPGAALSVEFVSGDPAQQVKALLEHRTEQVLEEMCPWLFP